MVEEINELKREEQEKIHGDRKNGARSEGPGRLAGLVLVILGLYFLAENYFHLTLFTNWWALLILIPAAANLTRARRGYRARGTWRGSAGRALTSGLLLTAVALIFLFGLDFGTYWPVLLIIFGAGILVRS